MTTITAADVKKLRDMTGAGMMDCKTALTETNGDIEAAVDWLRKKGLSKAAKKSGRIAADGLIGVVAKGRVGAVVEVNSETDFVARNEQFQTLVRDITGLAADAGGDLKKLLSATYPGTKNNVETHVQEMVATIGENMTVRRTSAVSVKEGVIADYIHNRVADGLGKIGVLVALESAGDEPTLFELGRQIAMHIAAASPVSLDIDAVPADVIEREKAILAEKNQGKKPEVLEKIISGGIKAFAKENCLLEQQYIHDTSKTVAQAVKEAESRVGSAVKITGFIRYALGEGIDKKEEDFGEEVRKLAGGGR
ncbi:translation elongation factor Ts [Hyphomicrobium methylovorum]|uniref:translation elongation factor Ts n=1 Tax=Hyphomicrobium methylovorum TaxID=84 RepID=UPI0015E7E25F|nr:translation elongation factor Ts [Hyphomicrobium methylovorum]